MGGPATETPNGFTASGAVVFVSSGLAHNMVPIITTAAANAIEKKMGRGFGGVTSTLEAHGEMMGGRGRGWVQG